MHPSAWNKHSPKFATFKYICDIMSRSERGRPPPREEVVPDERCGRTCPKGTAQEANRAPQRHREAHRIPRPGQGRPDERGGAGSGDGEAEDAQSHACQLSAELIASAQARLAPPRTAPRRSTEASELP